MTSDLPADEESAWHEVLTLSSCSFTRPKHTERTRTRRAGHTQDTPLSQDQNQNHTLIIMRVDDHLMFLWVFLCFKSSLSCCSSVLL